MLNTKFTSIIITLLVTLMMPLHASFALGSAFFFDSLDNYILSDSTKLEVTSGVGRLPSTVDPTVVGTEDTTTDYSVDIAISADGNTVYVASEDQLEIIDVSTPASPSQIATYEPSTISYVNLVVISPDGDTAFIADDDYGIEVVDISTPASPSYISDYTDNYGYDLAISSDGAELYFNTGGDGLEIINSSNLASLSLTGSYDTADWAEGGLVISADGNTAYVGDETSGIVIIDISTPASPTLIGSLDTSGYVYDLVLSSDENTMYVADGSDGLQIIDISTPASPSLVTSLDTSNSATGIALSSDGNTIYIADDTGGMKLIDVSTPTAPSLIVTLATPSVTKIVLSPDGETAYFADGNGGVILSVVDLTPLSYPSDDPYITNNRSQRFEGSLQSFTQTLGTGNEGSVSYQVSTDNGVTWKYWTGSAWATTTATDGTETSSAANINTNIASLDTDGGEFKFRAYLVSDGSEKVELDKLEIELTIRSSGGGSSSRASREESSFTESINTTVTESKNECSVSPIITQNLKQGDRNGNYSSWQKGIITDVQTFQKYLNNAGFKAGVEDGIFGPTTHKAAMQLQSSLGILADGMIGPVTRSNMTSSCN